MQIAAVILGGLIAMSIERVLGMMESSTTTTTTTTNTTGRGQEFLANICSENFMEAALESHSVNISSVILHDSAENVNASQFYFITYYTDNIVGHSQFAFAINLLYVSNILTKDPYHNFLYRYLPKTEIATGRIIEEWDLEDVRWNKVIILFNLVSNMLLEDSKEISHNLGKKYMVWLDSDLIVANHSLSFANLIQSDDNNVDIFISQEVNPDNGIANTGCMIVRVSQWSKVFLWRWWTEWDRRAGMDQHAFEALYRLLPHEEQSQRIRLLGVTEINSQFPGLINHHIHNPILHLAGESNFIRQFVFKQCWQSLCNYLHSPGSLQEEIGLQVRSLDNIAVFPPFGVSRYALDNIDYVSLHKQEWDNIKKTLKFILNATSSVSDKLILMQNLQYRIRETQQSLSKFVCVYLRERDILDSSSWIQSIHSDSSHDEEVSNMNRTECTYLKDIFNSDIVWSLSHVYQLYFELLQNNFPKASISKQIQLTQMTLDAGMELLTVLRYDTNEEADRIISYLAVIDQSLAIVLSMEEELDKFKGSSSDPRKVLKYYKYKLFEYRALYLEDTNKRFPNEGDVEVIVAWQHTFDEWREMVDRYHYFGTGNAIAHAYDEGITIALRLAFLYCSLQSKSIKDCRTTIESGQSYLLWVANVTDISMASPTNDVIRKYYQDWTYLVQLCEMQQSDRTLISKTHSVNSLDTQSLGLSKQRKFRKRRSRDKERNE